MLPPREVGNPRADLEAVAAPAAGIDQLGQRRTIDPQRVARAQGGVAQRHVRGHQRVVDQLGELPRADPAEMDDPAREALEHRARDREGSSRAADHRGQRARRRARPAAADRRVEDHDAARRRVRDQFEAGSGMHGRMNDQHRTRAHRREQLRGNRPHPRIVDHADRHQIAARGEIGGAGGNPGSGIGERRERPGPPRPQQRGKSGRDDPPRHRPALAAQPDEADRRPHPAVIPLSIWITAP